MSIIGLHFHFEGADFRQICHWFVDVGMKVGSAAIPAGANREAIKKAEKRLRRSSDKVAQFSAALTNKQKVELEEAFNIVLFHLEEARELARACKNSESKEVIEQNRLDQARLDDLIQLTSESVMTNVAVGGQRAASYMLYTSCTRKKIDPEDLVSKIAAATGTSPKGKAEQQAARDRMPSSVVVMPNARFTSMMMKEMAEYVEGNVGERLEVVAEV